MFSKKNAARNVSITDNEAAVCAPQEQVIDGMYAAALGVLYRQHSPLSQPLRQQLEGHLELLARHRLAVRTCQPRCLLAEGTRHALVGHPVLRCCSVAQTALQAVHNLEKRTADCGQFQQMKHRARGGHKQANHLDSLTSC